MKTRLLIIFLGCICSFTHLIATRWYITPTGAGANTGASWANACNASQLQTLINSGDLGDSVFVAQGIYKPTTGNNRNISFTLRSDLKMYGGFPMPSQFLPNPTWANRNYKLYPVVFSGDLQGNDLNADGNFLNQTADSIVGSDNSYHLFSGNIVNANCVIDGCVIVGGSGGTYGGGFYNYYYANPTIRNCYIVGNQSQYGGGVYNYDHSSPTFTNCVFRGNRGNTGAAMYNHYVANATINNSQLLDNIADIQGGAMYNNYAYPYLNNCVLAYNEAVQGGGIYNHFSAMILTSCILYQNVANVGGGVFNNSSSMTFNSSTLAQNMAITSGGGMKNAGTSNPKIRNTIIWDNFAANGKNIDNSGINNPLTYNSIIEGPYTGICINCQGANGNVNPQFTQINDADGADNIWMTNDDGLRLKPCSQGINAGANQFVPAYVTLDIRGKNRFRHQVTDLGAYENANFAGDGYLTTLNSSNTTLAACEECVDINGWTHYYDTVGKKMVLSLFKNGYEIGQIGDGTFQVKSFTTDNYGSGTGTAVNAPYAQNMDWHVMNRWWNVTPNPQLPVGNTGVKVRTYFTDQDTADIKGSVAGNTIAVHQLRFYKINGASASLDPDGDGNCNDAHAGVGAASTYDANGYWEYVYSSGASSPNTWHKGDFNGIDYAEYEVARFSGGGGGGATNGGGAFPMTLLSFDGNAFERGNALEWWTSQEIAGGHFVVERSKDGQHFEEIGDLAAVGNSLDKYQYRFFDNNPYWGTNHYRLKLTDYEGYIGYSQMLELHFENISFVAYPNPAQNFVRIEGNFPDRCELTIYDMVGLAVQHEPVNANVITEIAVHKLPKGMYNFKLTSKDGEIIVVKKVLIQN